MKEETAKKILRKVVDDYDNISDEFDKTRKNEWKEFETYIAYIQDNQKIADLGCGNGRLLNFIQKYRKINYVGIDNSKTLLKKANKYAKEYVNKEQKYSFIEGDLLDIPLKNESINTAIAVASFHHIPTKDLRKKSLSEINRILAENGLLIITVWNLFQAKYKKYIWKSRIRRIISFGRYESRDTFIPWGKSGIKRYYYAFKAEELEKLLRESGFTIIAQEIDKNITFVCKKNS